MRWLIYGYGTAAQRIAAAARRNPDFRGHELVVAGRNPIKAKAMADQFEASHRVFPVTSDRLAQELADIDLVVHCAGPFSVTSAPVLAACLRAKTHYLDITGELSVFRACFAQDAAARDAGVVVLPGVGMDVVPTDCLIGALAAEMPDASEVHLALLESGSARSPGTMKTAIEGIAAGNFVTENGQLKPVPMGHRHLSIEFEGKRRIVRSIPMGDVFTAHQSTNIPNVTVYAPVSRVAVWFGRVARPLLRTSFGLSMAQGLVDRLIPAPPPAATEGRGVFWAQVRNPSGAARIGVVITPTGAVMTAEGAAGAALEVLKGRVKAGATTPAKAFGHRFIERWGEVRIEDAGIGAHVATQNAGAAA